jgi:CRISPR-associated protein Csx10
MGVGGSRSAGYGHVLISKVQVVETWHEVGSSPIERGRIAEPYEADVDESDEDDYQEVDPSPLTHELHITLLSDMVVRNAYGQYDATFPVDALVQQLGLGREELQAVPARSFIATTSHGGFNRTWGLPMPQTLALASGSVLVFTLSQPLDTTRVARLEAHGLGERRVEGFGRVAVNWRPGAASFRLLRITRSSVRLTSSSNGDTETSIENATPSLFREEHTRLAQFMARRVFRQQMEKQLVDQVERCTIYGEISNTQLSRLHIVARRALIRLEGQQATSVQHIMEDVQQLLDTLPQNARHQFETARIQEHSLMKWLKIRINDQSTIGKTR